MRKNQLTKTGSFLVLGALSKGHSETTRPKTPPTRGAGRRRKGQRKACTKRTQQCVALSDSSRQSGQFLGLYGKHPGAGKCGPRSQQRYRTARLRSWREPLKDEHEDSCCGFKMAEAGIDKEGPLDVNSLT